MTTTTPTAKQVEERAEALLQYDVYCCQSALVDSLLKLSGESFTLNDNRELASAFGWEEVENLYPDSQGIFEWWSVSDWLAGELGSLGCPLLRNDYGTWWGRTCTGRAILMDGTLQDVARQILSRQHLNRE